MGFQDDHTVPIATCCSQLPHLPHLPVHTPCLWRICKSGKAWAPAKGEGRWHRGREGVIYASADPAAAVLEALAHLDRQDQAEPHELVRIELSPDLGGPVVSERELPNGWQQQKSLTRIIGNCWIDRDEQPLLWVPSALVPQAWNALLNAGHRAWANPRLICIPFKFDTRLCG